METKQCATKKPKGHWRKQKEIKKHHEKNEHEYTTIQNLWDAIKAVLIGKFIVIQAFLKKEEKSQIYNLTHHPNELEKEQKRPKVSRRKEIIMIKGEINKTEIQKTIEKINKIKSLFFEKVNKIDKPLARLTFTYFWHLYEWKHTICILTCFVHF